MCDCVFPPAECREIVGGCFGVSGVGGSGTVGVRDCGGVWDVMFVFAVISARNLSPTVCFDTYGVCRCCVSVVVCLYLFGVIVMVLLCVSGVDGVESCVIDTGA